MDLVTGLPAQAEKSAIEELGSKARKLDAKTVFSVLGSYPAKTAKKLAESGLLNVLA